MRVDVRRRWISCAPLLAALLALPVSSVAQRQTNGTDAERPTMVAVHLDGRTINLDGVLDEGVWRTAVSAKGFLQVEPNEGGTPSESTEVYVLYDETDLYIGAILYDSDPSGILAFQKERDAPLFTDDRFQWILDTFHDGRTGYFFEVNPAGLMGDGLLGGGGGGRGGFGGFGTNKSWDGIWEARVTRGPYGWSAEVKIPFATLNFNPSIDAWGINFQRTVRRKSEEIRWSGSRRNQRLTRPVFAGEVTGLTNISQGLGLEAKPYAVAGWQNVPNNVLGDPTDYPADAGIDLSYNVTPSIRASVTLNTDFAEVEVDQRRVNLTRFPLFFPERRDFFLEGSGVFSFAPSNGVSPYFSRNIGLSGGRPVPITYGARVGGQTGRYELGFFQVRSGQSDQIVGNDEGTGTEINRVAAEDFTVARIKRTMFEQSSIGAIYTRRHTANDSLGVAPNDRHTFGMDVDLYTSRFLTDKNLQFEAFFVWNSDPDNAGASVGDLAARGARINFPNDVWRIHTSYRELPELHNPAIGFTRRNGFRRLQPTVTFAPRPRDLLNLRQVEFRIQYEHLTNMAWELETRKTDFKLVGLRFNAGDRFDFDVTQLFERLDNPFRIRDGIAIPVGGYDNWSWRAQLRTAGRRILSGNIEIGRGGFWSGTRDEYEGGLTVRPAPGLNLRGRYERNDVKLPEGNFTTNLYRLEAGWHFSPWSSFSGNVQYDDVSEVVGLYGRFRWIITPGSELFFVYTHNWSNLGLRLFDLDYATLSRSATTKINYTYRF